MPDHPLHRPAGAPGSGWHDGRRAMGRLVFRPADRRVAILRFLSTLALVVLLEGWQLRVTGVVSWSALLLVVGCVLACVLVGARLAALTTRLVGPAPGMAYEFLLGFFACNTLLFVVTLASPYGMSVHVPAIGVAALIVGSWWPARALRQRRSLRGEAGSLACIVFTGLAATLWVTEQQPLVQLLDDRSVFRVWTDVFIHAREISAFAQAHGLATIEDIKLAGVIAPVYHFAPYMMPAAFDAMTRTSAVDAYAAFQLPFGILLVGLSAYALAAVALRTTWPAVVASAALVALPDALHQGVAIRYLSFHFMSQVNLGMLYGLACAALAWLFMIEACRRGRLVGVVVAYGFLAILVTYKAHLFVANALVLMIYPCWMFDRSREHLRVRWRVLSAVVATVVFTTVIAVSQRSPRVPTFRLDGSGLRPYIDILMGGFHDGLAKRVFRRLYEYPQMPKVIRGVLGVMLVAFASFGAWVLVAPLAWWKTRRSLNREAAIFVGFVVVNYAVMSFGLALDERKIGTPEEFVNRPHAWAYYVVVLFGAAALCLWWRAATRSSRGAASAARWAGPALAGLLLVGVQAQARRLETFPEWVGHADYVEFNTVPTCLVRAAEFVRDHSRVGELLQDAEYDPALVVTALAERQGFVAQVGFGGRGDLVRERIGDLQSAQASADPEALAAWARAHRVTWYVAHPGDAAASASSLGARTVYRCGGYGVIRF